MTQKKWLDLGILAIALFLFFAFKSGLNFVWEVASLPTPDFFETFPFSLPDAIVFVVMIAVVVGVRSLSVVETCGQEVVVELSKVTWPARKETVMSTGIVLVMLAIVSVVLFLIDSLWGTITKGILEL